jgi:hypothetical protein
VILPYFFKDQAVTMYVLVYVDDIIVVSPSETAASALLRNLEKDLALKDLGELLYFLGIEVEKINGGILLSQNKYVDDLLKKMGMFSCKPMRSPLSTLEKLSNHIGDLLGPADATKYQSIVGGLQYLTLTRPNLAFSINKVCQYLQSPTMVHLTAIKRIL